MRMLVPVSAVVLGTILVVTPAAQSRSQQGRSDSLQTPFVANGRISMDLSAGGYRISASQDDRIHLQWTVRNRSQLQGVEARAEVDGSDATIVLDGPTNNFHVTIEVPKRSDLSIRLSAGELSVEDIVGDKDIRLNAGELRIDVGHPADYGRVEGSVWAGELSAAPFRIGKGGLFRSFDWRGDGEYRLRAPSRLASSTCTRSPPRSSRGPGSSPNPGIGVSGTSGYRHRHHPD